MLGSKGNLGAASRSGLVLAMGLCCLTTHAAEGALGRPISGTSMVANAGIVPPEPVTVVNFGEIYFDGSISGGRLVPLVGQTSLDVDAKVAFTLATLLKVWDTGPGAWNFASSITLPYVWTQVNATLTAGPRQAGAQDTASNLFDLYVTPITAGYHFSKTEHVALSFNIWAPTGRYDKNALANPSLNNWTFIPQVAYTRILPEQGLQFDAVAGLPVPNAQQGDRLRECAALHARRDGLQEVFQWRQCRPDPRHRPAARR